MGAVELSYILERWLAGRDGVWCDPRMVMALTGWRIAQGCSRSEGREVCVDLQTMSTEYIT